MDLPSELAYSVMYTIIQAEGGKADFGIMRLRYNGEAEMIRNRYRIEINNLFESTLKRFKQNPDSGLFSLPRGKRPRTIEKLVEEIASTAPRLGFGPPPEVLEHARQFELISERMQLPQQLLARWRSSFKDLIGDLRDTMTTTFVSRDNAPSSFEFTLALAVASIFQIPMEQGYGQKDMPEPEQVIWRGRAEFNPSKNRFESTDHAPGGAADIICRLRGFDLLVEATLRYTERQWKEEIEPIFRHLATYVERRKISSEDAFLLFVTPLNLLPNTFVWVKARGSEYAVVAIDVETIIQILEVSEFVPGMPHALVRNLLSRLRDRIINDADANTYSHHLKEITGGWSREVLGPHFTTFLSMKAFEGLLQTESPLKTNDLLEQLSSNPDVARYVRLADLAIGEEGKAQAFVRSKRTELLRQMELLGLAREFDGYIVRLPWDEFQNRMFKVYGEASTLKSSKG